MDEIIKHINDTNASYRSVGAGDAKNTDLFFDNKQYELFKDCGDKIKVRYHKVNLTQAILFIASILPRKFDQSAMHKVVDYSNKFVLEQFAILDALFIERGKPVDSFTQEWNIRKDVSKKNGEIDSRFYFNGLLKDVAFFDSSGVPHPTKFTIRNYLAGGYSHLKIIKAEDGIFDIHITNALIPENVNIPIYPKKSNELLASHQQIYYGAPGTGKSYKVNELTKGESVVRTTFHPDSDYSTFVGAYKPTMEKTGVKNAVGNEEEHIVYKFVPQAFLQAYVGAWKSYPTPEYLVIEEINRGNCAQIFGDLFQLLDRNANGFSEYFINADRDLSKYLSEEFSQFKFCEATKAEINIGCGSVIDRVLTGEIMLLPSNLYILATMNTSDQSLFPIDSAFKRRWDWVYVPIADVPEKDWKIVAGANEYDWWDFLTKINERIGATTNSEDKKLGFFFCRADNDGVIDAKTFVGKVLFYLWNDVFKDYGFDSELFKGADGKPLTFDKFYNVERGEAVPDVDNVQRFLGNLGVESAEHENT